MSLGILGGGGSKRARPLSYSLKGVGLGAMAFCPSPCSTVDADVKTYQAMMNVQLKRMKYNQVAVDGKLGKGTCGLNMFFSQVPELFDTTVASWNDDLAYQVDQACSGQPYALPTPVKPANSVFAPNSQDPVCKSQSLPWGGSSMADPNGSGTISVPLTELNTQLNELGYMPISSTKIDAVTCGAMKLIDAANNTQYLCQPGFNCQSFTTPTKKPATAVTPAPVTAPTATTSAPAKTSTASMATTGLILGVVGTGLYFVGKHYHWFGR
jgi:hypothetical protein